MRTSHQIVSGCLLGAVLWASRGYFHAEGPARPGAFGEEGSVSAYEAASSRGIASSSGIVDVCTPPDSWLVADTTLYFQRTTEWCWAASGQMILHFFKKNVSQCTQANEQFGLHKCCKKKTPGDCISSGWPHFEIYGLKPAIKCNQALSWEEVKTQLYCRNQPFAFTWHHIGSAGGHMMVAVGYKTVEATQFVCVNNPWPPMQGDFYCHTYEEYVSDPTHHTHWNDYYAFTEEQPAAKMEKRGDPCAP
jgi:Papain-like cysteine protease AvrRpt2